MAKINIDGIQNAEVSIKIPCEKNIQEQLQIMKEYTRVHKESKYLDKAQREINCIKVLFPTLFRSIETLDLIAGRLDFLPIGFGSVTSIGGVGHYCVFHKLRAFKDVLDTEQDKQTIDELYDYWQDNDVKSIYCQDVLNEETGRFIDCKYPFMATARLSGMMLDYKKLLRLGLDGLLELLVSKKKNAFISASIESIYLLQDVIEDQKNKVITEMETADESRKKELTLILHSLTHIKHHKAETFHQGLQLFWLYALCAGAINYGRLDDLLGTLLKHDIQQGRLNEEEAYRYVKSLWTMIENRRTTVNGRIIVGGYGREDEEGADLFAKICLRVCKDTRYVEPQFTFRITKDTPTYLMDMAYECIASGATYPTLYNDDVNVPASMYGMRVSESIAQHYVPFGCGEFVIQGKSIGTPNVLINMLKILQMTMNEGYDPMDRMKRVGTIHVPNISEYNTFDDLYNKYKEILNYYYDLSIKAQMHSYTIMNQEVSFLFNSILMDDCITREQAMLDGGIEILGGTNETYGNINASDSLYAIKTLVYEQKKYTLKEINDAALANFEGYEAIRKDLWNIPKYGNDHDACDALANDLYEHVAIGMRQRGIDAGMGYFLIVISNNQTNTDWGLQTAASYDGRKSGVYMNPANNPQGGAAKNGPTATLNSLCKFNAKYHGGSVQNIKFTPRMMHEDKIKVQALFDTYFKKGGCQLMVTVVDHGILEDAQEHPQNYPDLIVRVAGYSAVFINLNKDIQNELLSRELYD